MNKSTPMNTETNNEVKLSTAPQFETNPFMVNLKGKMYLQPRANSIIVKGQEIIDSRTGEVIADGTLIGRQKIVDKSQFAKIYASEIGTLYNLSKSSMNVFLHLTEVMDYDNRVYFNYYKEYKKLGYKTCNPCYKGLVELLQKDIIALDVRENSYWMNPTIVCKGERFAKYTEYVTQDRLDRDAKIRMQQEELKEQGRDRYYSLDEETRDKMDLANRAEQSRLERAERRGEDLYDPM